ncbi:MAG TPA: hypothetical protein VGO08_03965 [Burkholderiales bacterium]|nr:hypothetical protein [Burkholderiales bacterium]
MVQVDADEHNGEERFVAPANIRCVDELVGFDAVLACELEGVISEAVGGDEHALVHAEIANLADEGAHEF